MITLIDHALDLFTCWEVSYSKGDDIQYKHRHNELGSSMIVAGDRSYSSNKRKCSPIDSPCFCKQAGTRLVVVL